MVSGRGLPAVLEAQDMVTAFNFCIEVEEASWGNRRGGLGVQLAEAAVSSLLWATPSLLCRGAAKSRE